MRGPKRFARRIGLRKSRAARKLVRGRRWRGMPPFRQADGSRACRAFDRAQQRDGEDDTCKREAACKPQHLVGAHAQ